MSQAIFSIAPSEVQAEAIVSQFKEQRFACDDISVPFPDKTGTRHLAHERHTKAPGAEDIASAAEVRVGEPTEPLPARERAA